MLFSETGYQVVPELVGTQSLQLMQLEFDLLIRNFVFEQTGSFDSEYRYSRSDSIAIGKSFSWYSVPCFESLMLHLKPVVEHVTGKRLFPTYSYARKYYTGASMFKHTDRNCCEYSITFTVSCNGNPWGIWFTDYKGNDVEVTLNPGDLCVYHGPVVPHWRNEYTGNDQTQVFMHYVDADGEFSNEKYDNRPFVGMFSGAVSQEEIQNKIKEIRNRN